MKQHEHMVSVREQWNTREWLPFITLHMLCLVLYEKYLLQHAIVSLVKRDNQLYRKFIYIYRQIDILRTISFGVG